MTKTKQEILDEYKAAASSPNEHEMHGWRTEQNWLNRFEILSLLIPWSKIESWADVGCGTARFFTTVLANHDTRLQRITGIDAVTEYLDFAGKRNWPAHIKVELLDQDIEKIRKEMHSRFELVTTVGVIYQCGITPDIFIENVRSLVAKNGMLLITTENPEFHLWKEEDKENYPAIMDMVRLLTDTSAPPQLDIYYGNPLEKKIALVKDVDNKPEFKEVYFLATYS